jgi:hypothetical protein
MTNVSRHLKTRLLISLAICMLLILIPVISSGASTSDISAHWAKNQIQSWMDEGIVNCYPDGSFKPDNAITRAEFMSLVNKAFGFTTEQPISFSDVKADAWYADVIGKAMAAGYISGYSDGTIRPDDTISREEAATMMMKITKLESNEAGVLKMIDAGNMTWSKAAVGSVLNASIMCGYADHSFMPTGEMSRAEAVTALVNAQSFEENKSIDQTLTGYIMDEHCFVKKPIPGSDTKTCLQMPTCAATGYGIAVLQMDGSYKFYYVDGDFAPAATATQASAVKLINDTVKKDHIYISVTGKIDGSFETASDGFSYPVISASAIAETTEQTLSGYIMDEHCFIKKPVPGSDTKMCLLMPTCAATGYGIAVLQNDGSYSFYYFDGAFAPNPTGSQVLASDLIKATTKMDQVTIAATGTLNGDSMTAPDGRVFEVLTVTGLVEK